MIFNKNILLFRHEEGFEMELNSVDALKKWLETCYDVENIPKVEYSAEWTQEREKTLSEVIKTREKPYDWTFSTLYSGTLRDTKQQDKVCEREGLHLFESNIRK